jgi:hypothetical protein
MNDRAALLAFYEAMSPWARKKLLDTAQQYVQHWPLPKPAPRLHLVSRRPEETTDPVC